MKSVFVLFSAFVLAAPSPLMAKSAASSVSAPTPKPSPRPEPEEKAPDRPPFDSEEDVDYTAVTAENKLGFMRPDEFIGVMIRPFAEKTGLRQVEVYEIDAAKNVVIDHNECERAVAKILGPLNKISLKHEKTQLFKSTLGMACEVVMRDPDPQALGPDRHLFVANLKKGVYILQFKFKPKASADDVADMRKFLKGLK